MTTQRNFDARLIGFAVAFALLTACGGGGSSSGTGAVPIPGNTATPGGSTPPSATPSPTATPAPTPTPTPAPPGASSQTIRTAPGAVIGQAGQFQPPIGDTAVGGQGMPVDGINCDPTSSNNYHVHFYLGLWVNGTQVAIPAGLGMQNPAAPQNGFINSASCFYHIHTHDASGLIHIEDPDPANIPITQSLFTLKNLFDIWGISVSPTNFGSFSGPVRVFTSGQLYRGGAPNQTTPASDLTFFGTDPNAVPLYSYEIVDVEVGPAFPSTLPNVYFYEVR